MEKLKIDKKKHNHKLTDLLKVAIFSLIMLAPMFAIASKCIYVACNKNAKDSYTKEELVQYTYVYYETNDVETTSDLVEGNVYRFTYNQETTNNTNIDILTYEQWIIEIIIDNDSTGTQYASYPYFRISSNNQVLIPYETIETNRVRRYVTTKCTIDFVYKSNVNLSNDFISTISKCPIQHVKQILEHPYESQLDNVFYDAVNDIKNQTLFNWTTDTAIYSAINGMCNGLAVQDGVLPILLTYWSLMTAIYIVFDLIIFTFTKITHFVNSD